jgi:hypothetical protein
MLSFHSTGMISDVRTRGNGSAFNTGKVRRLNDAENQKLAGLASEIPKQFRGCTKNADDLSGYELTAQDCTTNETLEPPSLRARPGLFRSRGRARWTKVLKQA